MTDIIASWFEILGIVTLIVFLSWYIYHRLVSAKYWSNLNVPHVKPTFLLGTFWKANFVESLRELVARIYHENKDKKLIGVWHFHNPRVVATDIDLIRRILISDFNNFRDRGLHIDEKKDPLAGHLFLIGQKRWRNLRVKLAPTFSSGKMKMMFSTMLKCAEELRQHLKEPAERREAVEVRDLLARFATDVVGSCAFGIETNSLKNPNSEFREYGRKIFVTSNKQVLLNTISLFFPQIANIFNIRLIPKDVSDFFIKIVDDTIQYRERTNTVRNDFLQLLIQLMRVGKIEDVDKTPVDHLSDEEIVWKFSLHEAAAQCFAFFAAGFETSSSVLTFMLYELALNPDIQTRLQREIDEMLESSDGEMRYEKVVGLEYLDMVVHETLRKYPSVGIIQRQSLNDYHIPEMNVTLDKGTVILISVSGIQRDPEFYPDPDKFDPERFSPEEKSKRDPCTYLPFGEGPRNCIGSRFAYMQIKVALISMLRDYSVEVTKTTPIPIVFSPKGFVLALEGGMNLVFAKRD